MHRPGGYHGGPGRPGRGGFGGGPHRPPMSARMWHRPPRRRRYGGCLFPVIGLLGVTIAVFLLLL